LVILIIQIKNSLLNQEFVVKVPEVVAEKAKNAIDRMLEIS
jgi:quinolinate synthase